MLTTMKELFAIAEKRNCAIPAFNVYNGETAMGIFKAAEEADACVIVQMYSRLFMGPDKGPSSSRRRLSRPPTAPSARSRSIWITAPVTRRFSARSSMAAPPSCATRAPFRLKRTSP